VVKQIDPLKKAVPVPEEGRETIKNGNVGGICQSGGGDRTQITQTQRGVEREVRGCGVKLSRSGGAGYSA